MSETRDRVPDVQASAPEVPLALSRAGVAVGLKTIAAAVGEDERTVEDVYEPHLLREGLLLKTPQGRRLSQAGWAHLGVEVPGPTDGMLPL